MGLNDEVEILRRIPMFANVAPAQVKLLAFASDRLTYAPGERLFSQGEEGDAAYVVIDGEADVVVDTGSESVPIARVTRNALVGEIAILCEVPRTASVVAASPLVVLRISKDMFFRIVMEFPGMAVEIMRVLADRLERTTLRLREALADAAH